jgi:hypothetical protein
LSPPHTIGIDADGGDAYSRVDAADDAKHGNPARDRDAHSSCDTDRHTQTNRNIRATNADADTGADIDSND